MKDIYQVIKKVRISEKATMLQETTGELVFEVDRDANKIEIKKAVEVAFGKKVATCVPPTMTASSSARRRSDADRTAHWKKAYVKLANGETLTSFKAPIRKESYHVPQVIQASYSL